MTADRIHIANPSQSYTLASHTSQRTDQSLPKSMPAQPHKDSANSTRQNYDRKEGQLVTAPWQKSGFSGYINICASNKLLWWLDSFVLLSPLLRQAAKRTAKCHSWLLTIRERKNRCTNSFFCSFRSTIQFSLKSPKRHFALHKCLQNGDFVIAPM